MKKNIPDSDEWKKIVDEAFSSDEIHIFSENYKMKKQSMRKGIIMKRNNLLMNLTVTAAALAVVAFPTGIYLSTRTAETTPSAELPSEEVETTSEDEVTIADDTGEEFATEISETEVAITDGEDDGQVNEEIHQFTEDNIDYDTIYDLEYGWLPEGLEFQDQDSPYGGKFHNWTTEDGMTPIFTKVMEGVTYTEDTGNPEIATTKDEWLLDGKTVSMYYRSTYIPDNQEHNFGRIAFIYFDNTPYVLKLYVTDGISEEDFKKIIDNVHLVPSEEETAYVYTLEEEKILKEYEANNATSENAEFIVGSYDNLGTPADSFPIVQIGEPVQETYPEGWGEVSATVTGVHFSDNFDGIITDGIGWEADYSEYLNENGTLVENVRQWERYSGDQTETMESETVPVSVMTVNITYTNNGTTPSDYCVCPTLQTMYDGYFFKRYIYNKIITAMREATDNVHYSDTFHSLETDDLHFSFSCTNQSNKNNISIAPGESVEVTLAYIVEDNLRDNLYLSMNDNGFVDLSNIE